MRRIMIIVIAVVLGTGCVLEGSAARIDATSSWSVRGRSAVRNATAESAYMNFVPTAALDEVVTRRGPARVQLQVTWRASEGQVPVELKWTRWCWNQVSGEIEDLKRWNSPPQEIWLAAGDSYTRGWSTSKDFCAVSAEASTEKPESGRLVLVVRDRR